MESAHNQVVIARAQEIYQAAREAIVAVGEAGHHEDDVRDLREHLWSEALAKAKQELA